MSTETRTVKYDFRPGIMRESTESAAGVFATVTPDGNFHTLVGKLKVELAALAPVIR